MSKPADIFNAKILLFGEYLVIYNATALTVPYSYFNGHFSFIGENRYTQYDMAVNSSVELQNYLDFYRESPVLQEDVPLDVNRFQNDLNEGLYFESNIPQAYGLGSSGALIAAIYNQYALNPIPRDDENGLKKLKQIFSGLESYFHGTSSGMDPLNCYIGKPLLFEDNGQISLVNIPGRHSGEFSIFLADSGYPGNTQQLVKLFITKNENADFHSMIINEHIPLNNLCAEAVISGKTDIFFPLLKEYSRFQLFHFKEMIPSGFSDIWQKGLQDNDYYLKLCGSGGGGVILGFTRNFEKTARMMKEAGIQIMRVSEPGKAVQNEKNVR